MMRHGDTATRTRVEGLLRGPVVLGEETTDLSQDPIAAGVYRKGPSARWTTINSWRVSGVPWPDPYYRYRYLEIAGRYEEIFASDMMADNPVYHFHALGISARLEGQDAIRNLYRTWTETGECVMYTDDEKIAVGDSMIASMMTGYQFKPGEVLAAAGFDVGGRWGAARPWSSPHRGRRSAGSPPVPAPASARARR
jgi:hypothetical protein